MSEEKKVMRKVIFGKGRHISISKSSIEEIDVDLVVDLEGLTKQKQIILDQVFATISAYINEVQKLLKGKYASIKDIAPLHLRNPGIIIIILCKDGIILRYDQKYDEHGIGITWLEEGLSYLAPKISDNVLYCYYDENLQSSETRSYPEITVSKTDTTTGQSIEISKVQIGFNILIKPPKENLPAPPNKPFCLVSVQNSAELNISGEMRKNDTVSQKGKRFITRTPIKLPVGWECIELYPFFRLDNWIDNWKPEYAGVWAEKDILGFVVKKHLRDEQFNDLDPNVAARKQFAALLNSYNKLLDSDPEREESLQSFLKENPILLCPDYTEFWPKLALGKKITDFVFRKASGDYLLVEIEKSTIPLFKKNGDIRHELNHAKDQIIDWKRYLEDNLSSVQRELGLDGISVNPESLVIYGRSHSLNSENRRKIVTIENQNPRLKIMTYDDVLANSKMIFENLLGPLLSETGTTEIYFLPDK